MVLCLFIYFLALNFDWSIILIRKSFRASRHISGKLGVKLAIDLFDSRFLYEWYNMISWFDSTRSINGIASGHVHSNLILKCCVSHL